MNRCWLGSYSLFTSRRTSCFKTLLLLCGLVTSCSSSLSTITNNGGGSGSLLQVNNVSAYADNTCVLRSGTPYCSGNDDYNQVFTSTSSSTETWEPSLKVMSTLSSVTSISGGTAYACVLQSTALKCWGDNSTYQLGVAAPASSLTSLITTIASLVSSFSTGLNHACAIDTTANLSCWGKNTNGQVGDGTTVNVSTPTVIDSGTLYSQISAGATHTCGVTSVGGVKCWGLNSSGQLGNGTTVDSSSPVSVTISSVAQVKVAGTDSCALTTAGALYCWGSNTYGEFSLGDQTARTSPTLVQSGVSSFALSHSSTLCFVASSVLKCSGSAAYGQLGQDSNLNLSTATAVSGVGSGVSSLSAGNSHFCAISSGYMYCWGLNKKGQLAIAKSGQRYSPKYPLGNQFTSIKASVDSVCGLQSGSVSCWGTKEVQGRSLNASSRPVAITGSSYSDLAVGSKFACGVQNGNLTCWGVNSNLGISSTSPSVKISGSVTAAAAGSNHACAVVSGALQCWGDNTYGQLGDGTTTSTTSVVTSISASVTAVYAGYNNTCAIVGSALKCWGDNAHYQLATVAGAYSATPLQIFATQYTAAIGNGHICALASGTLKCWGQNSDGQVGDGTSGTDVSTPYTVLSSSVTAMSLSGKSTYVIASGSLYAFGDNSTGMLGDGTLVDKLTTTFISSSAQSVFATGSDVCAKLGLSSYCWGQSAGGMGDDSEWVSTPRIITN